MMTPAQVDLLRTLGHLSAVHPTMRFGQLLANIASLVDMVPEATWTVEDQPLLDEARDHLASQIERLDLPEAPDPDDPTREELLRELGGLIDLKPVARLGGAVADLIREDEKPLSTAEWAGAIWEIEDDRLLAVVREAAQGAATARMPVLPR